MSLTQELTTGFLTLARKHGMEVNPVKVLRSNTYSIGSANVLIRTASDLGRRYFFGLNYINAEEIYNLSNSFVVFICGDLNRLIFFPCDVLIAQLPNVSHDRNGEYKINFTRELDLILRGKNHRLDCSQYINNWDLLKRTSPTDMELANPEESIHSVLQGRIIEIGNIRGYSTYAPDKSKTFNRVRMSEIMTLTECPKLEFSDYELLRKIDVLWFRKLPKGFYPEYAFEIEISTGVWSGFGRLATLREYSTKMFIVTFDERKFCQVSGSFPELKDKYANIIPDKIGLLYSAEKSLIRLRQEFNL